MYDIMLDLVGRILAQNPYLYAMIQMNPEVAKVHKAYIARCNLMADMVRNRDIEGFVCLMKKASAHFGDTESALRRSEKLVSTKIAEHEELVRSLGHARALKHIYSGVIHFGTIKKVSPRTVLLMRNGKTTELLIENVRLLNEKELQEWKAANLYNVKRDISFFIPFGSDPEIIRNIVSSCSGIASAKIIDIYDNKDIRSLTMRITILEDQDLVSVLGGVEKLLKGIGCTIR